MKTKIFRIKYKIDSSHKIIKKMNLQMIYGIKMII